MKDPYMNALLGFHGQERSSVLFINQKSKPAEMGPVKSTEATAAKLKVPVD